MHQEEIMSEVQAINGAADAKETTRLEGTITEGKVSALAKG